MVHRQSEEQFLQLYDQYADAVFRHCYFRVSDREKAKDLVQEAFQKYWEYAQDNAIENDKAFLFRIANNLIIDSYRKRTDESLDTLQETGFDPAGGDYEDILNAVTGRELNNLLEKLDPPYRDAVVMRYIEGMPVKDIAALLEETENSISVRIHRGLRKIRDMIQNHE